MLNGNRALADWCECADVFCSTYFVLSGLCFFFFFFFCSSEGWLPSDAQRCGGGSRGAGRHGVHPPQRSPRTDHLLEKKQHPGYGPRWQDHCEYAMLLDALQRMLKSCFLSSILTRLLKIIFRSPAGDAEKIVQRLILLQRRLNKGLFEWICVIFKLPVKENCRIAF